MNTRISAVIGRSLSFRLGALVGWWVERGRGLWIVGIASVAIAVAGGWVVILPVPESSPGYGVHRVHNLIQLFRRGRIVGKNAMVTSHLFRDGIASSHYHRQDV